MLYEFIAVNRDEIIRRIHARNLPNRGCVFTVDLPRFPVPALASVR